MSFTVRRRFHVVELDGFYHTTLELMSSLNLSLPRLEHLLSLPPTDLAISRSSGLDILLGEAQIALTAIEKHGRSARKTSDATRRKAEIAAAGLRRLIELLENAQSEGDSVIYSAD
jgi:hypothetical protein